MNELNMIVERARHGDTEAFAELYKRVYKKMYQYALYTLREEQDAKDAVSETVVEAYKGIGSLRSAESFNAWIFQILVNKCKRKMRDYYNQDISMDTEDFKETDFNQERRDNTYTFESGSTNIELGIDIRNAIMQLDSLERTIIGLHIVLGYKTVDIANMLSMNDNTVRSKESRALKKLRDRLKDWR